MKRTGRIVIGVVVLALIAVAAVFLYTFFIGGSGEPSTDISQVVSTIAPTAEAGTAPEGEGASGAESEAASAGVIFNIVPEESEARFIIDEILNNNPFTVVGVTNQVGGQLIVDFADPSKTQIGEIVVNVRTLATDDGNRDRAIRGFILSTDRFEFSRFMPTALNGLPESVTFGEPLNFTIDGDLTVMETTTPVTFEASVTPVSETRIEGLATLTINYADLGVSIPRLPPQVASVDEDIRLELDFVAVAG
jgi:polyisoprenoid-binding protein YceI